MKLITDTIEYKNFRIAIIRADKIGDAVQGNKYFKLKYNLEEAIASGFTKMLTFGGPFSNHIYAAAAAGNANGLETIGIIRGEDDPNNPTLQFVRNKGMHLEFVPREQFKKREEPDFLNKYREKYGPFYLLPEGGTNALAIKGCTEILEENADVYNRIFVSVGTGGTLAGLISTPGLKTHITGISALKGDDTLTKKVQNMLHGEHPNVTWNINFNFHYGGYAKFHPALVEFIRKFYVDYNIMLDPVYTGKTFGAVFYMIDNNKIAEGAKICVVHTGGLQGIAGWDYRFGKLFT